MGNARIREAQEAATKKKLQTDPRFTVLSFSGEQRAELQRVTAPAVAEWKANMAKLGIDGERLYTRARELSSNTRLPRNRACSGPARPRWRNVITGFPRKILLK